VASLVTRIVLASPVRSASPLFFTTKEDQDTKGQGGVPGADTRPLARVRLRIGCAGGPGFLLLIVNADRRSPSCRFLPSWYIVRTNNHPGRRTENPDAGSGAHHRR